MPQVDESESKPWRIVPGPEKHRRIEHMGSHVVVETIYKLSRLVLARSNFASSLIDEIV